MNARELIAALGGYQTLAERIGADRTTVCRWQRYGIPAHRWPSILRVAAEDRAPVSLETLQKCAPERLT